MCWQYRNRKKKRINGFFVVCATKSETGLPYDILFDSLGSEKKFPGQPRIGVIIDKIVVPVLISDKPVVLSGYAFPGSEKILKWVAVHKTNLLCHWNKELSDLELLNLITKEVFHERV